MIKYDLFTDTFEFLDTGDRWTSGKIQYEYNELISRDPIRISQADTFDGLKNEFENEKLRCSTYKMPYNRYDLICGKICYVEIGEYDDTGEYIQGGDVVEFYAKDMEDTEI